jgi:hypothetical protein
MIRLAAASIGAGARSCTRRVNDHQSSLRSRSVALPRRDVMPLDPGVLTPREDGVTGPLGTIIAEDHARRPATFGDGGPLADDAPA